MAPFAAAILLLWALPQFAAAENAADDADDLLDMTLEELLGLEVTTFSRKLQLLSATPAAMFVVTQTDIARSGARTIPDVLRMVPGLQVAQADSGTWAVTSRGSNGIFANKLLVLQDGRSLYSPLYSGVYWDTNDTDLASIDRIEVIRGPGATMWGSNAVNGVINIITKNTQDSQGGRIDAVAGTERTEGTLSYGGKVGTATYRAFGKYFERDGFIDSTGSDDSPDDWDMLRGGVRVDWNYDDQNTLMFSSEVYAGDIGERTVTPDLQAPPFYNIVVDADREVSGEFALVAWDHRFSDTSALKLQIYYDHTEIENIAPNETRDTFDIDMQHQFGLGSRNDFVWGLGYRSSKDKTVGDFVIALDPERRTQEIYSAFVQDEIRLIDDQLFLLVGTKVSDNSFSNSNPEWEPNVRLSWNVNESHMLWSSVARAVRIPSRVEQDGTIHGGIVPPGVPVDNEGSFFDVPFLVTIQGNPDLKTEEVTAYELGYRGQLSESVETDISLFFNHYENLRSIGAEGPPVCQPESGIPPSLTPPSCDYFPPFNDSYVEMTLDMANAIDQDSYGAEFNLSWRAAENLYLQGAYTFLKVDDVPLTPLSAGVDSPEHQLSARSLWKVSDSASIDLWLRYVSELEAQDIASYVTMDARLGWMLMPQLELSLVGRNLFEDEHAEFVEEFGAQSPAEVPREVYLELLWQF